MPISPNAKRIVDTMYAAYGTDSGHLFGLLPNEKHSVEAIVQATILMDSSDYELIAEAISLASSLIAAHPTKKIPVDDIRRALIDSFIVRLELKHGFDETKFRKFCDERKRGET